MLDTLGQPVIKKFEFLAFKHVLFIMHRLMVVCFGPLIFITSIKGGRRTRGARKDFRTQLLQLIAVVHHQHLNESAANRDE